MKNNILFLLLMLSSLFAKGQSIPVFTGETADNKNVILPDQLKGKYSLICFASSQKAEGDLLSWLDPVYQKYIAKTGIMDDAFDVNVYFIPVLTGTNLAFETSMKKKFKEMVQADLQSHVLFCTKDGNSVLKTLNMQKSDVPYFFLLDKNMKIIFRTSGKFTEEKLYAMDDLIQ